MSGKNVFQNRLKKVFFSINVYLYHAEKRLFYKNFIGSGGGQDPCDPRAVSEA